MKKIIILIFITILIAIICKSISVINIEHPSNVQTNLSDTLNNVSFINRQTLDKLLPNIIAYLELNNEQALSDSALQKLFPDTEMYIDESGTIRNNDDQLTVTKIIDGKHIFAIGYSNEDSLLIFSRLHNGQWKETGRYSPKIPVGTISFEELNGKPCMEIIAGTWYNMNANSWKECFVYFPEEDTVRFAGDFCTDYTVNLKDKTISESYEGSSYMNPHKILYVWYNDELIELKKAVISVPEDWNTNDKRTLEYYERQDYKHPIKLIFSETYNEYNSKHRKYWDDFFENQ